MIKKFTIILSAAVLFAAVSCGGGKKSEDGRVKVRIGFVGESDNQIWAPVVKALSEEAIDVELVSFSDYTIPNQALNDGEIDMNAFQHHAYIREEIKSKGYKIAPITKTYISAMNIYSKKVKDVREIKNGDKIAIPNDPSNGGRALKVIQSAGLIKINAAVGDAPEIKDITDNPLNIQFVEVDAGSLYSILPDVAAAVINCNYALDFGLNPSADYIFRDNQEAYTGDAFINLIAVRESDLENETYKKVVKAYKSDAVKDVYANNFKGAYIPTW